MKTPIKLPLVLLLAVPVASVDNGLGLTPPMGWRSWNCFGGNVNQTMMTEIMDSMVATDREIDGKKSSLHSIGYDNCGLDGNPLIDKTKFPNMGEMVDHGHQVGIRVGWYMNNCICSERQFPPTGEMVTKIMEKSVAALVGFKFDGLKLDSCSQFNNLTWWNKLINATGRPILVENCHQGGLAPGAVQWQTYIKDAAVYTHKLGYLSAGDDIKGSPAANVTAEACFQMCTSSSACLGLSFEADVAMPKGILKTCYMKSALHFIDYDATNSKCTGLTTPSDCPFNFFRTSGDINPSWKSMIGNLATVPPYLGSETKPAYSRPGAWAYPGRSGVSNPGKVAVLFLNGAALNATASTFNITLSDVGLSGTVAVRDIWKRADLAKVTGTFTTDAIAPHDSRFYVLGGK
eukprot:gene1884-17200_t